MLRRYIVHNHFDLMNEPERRAWVALTMRKKYPEEKLMANRILYAKLRVDPSLAVMVEAGEDDFLDLLVSRIPKERKADILINRCPECRKIIRTPRARLCLWCGYDWH